MSFRPRKKENSFKKKTRKQLELREPVTLQNVWCSAKINSDTFIQMLFLKNLTMHQKLEISLKIIFFIPQPFPVLGHC